MWIMLRFLATSLPSHLRLPSSFSQSHPSFRKSSIRCKMNAIGMEKVITPTFSSFTANRRSRVQGKPIITSQRYGIKAMRTEKPLEELYNIRVERKVTPERLSELGVSRWSMWKTGKCKLPWDWQVDQLVYIEEGVVKVVPEGSKRSMSFSAGDLVRYPKWLEADLFFNGPYQERYSFRAYGDD